MSKEMIKANLVVSIMINVILAIALIGALFLLNKPINADVLEGHSPVCHNNGGVQTYIIMGFTSIPHKIICKNGATFEGSKAIVKRLREVQIDEYALSPLSRWIYTAVANGRAEMAEFIAESDKELDKEQPDG